MAWVHLWLSPAIAASGVLPMTPTYPQIPHYSVNNPAVGEYRLQLDAPKLNQSALNTQNIKRVGKTLWYASIAGLLLFNTYITYLFITQRIMGGN